MLKSSRVQAKDESFVVVESVEANLDSADACTLLSSPINFAGFAEALSKADPPH